MDKVAEPTRSLRPRLHQMVHQPTRPAASKRKTRGHVVSTTTELENREIQTTNSTVSEYRLHFPTETADIQAVDGVLGISIAPQALHDRINGTAQTVDSSDIHRVMGGLLNDKAVDEYLKRFTYSTMRSTYFPTLHPTYTPKCRSQLGMLP